MKNANKAPGDRLLFYGGTAGALMPFAVFLVGVAWLGLSGAPDERGFWPVLLGALAVGMVLARDRAAYSETVLGGMSRPIVMVMVMAWLLAGVLGAIIGASGFIESLVWAAQQIGVRGAGFVAAAFLVCCIVSTATGTSLGTILICGPLLYPAGGSLAAHPAALIGAVIGGATFGDNISPVSDTTIASATTQRADLGGVVRSRLKYAIPAASLALVGYLAVGGAGEARGPAGVALLSEGGVRNLMMVLGPIVVIGLLLRKRHLMVGLLSGILVSAVVGLTLGVIPPSSLLYIDSQNYIARGIILDGLERGIGVSIFTVLLMGLVGALESSGVVDRFVKFAERHARSPRSAEFWIFGAVSGAVLATTHSVVAILTVGDFARDTGHAFGVGPYRRANILDITVCTYPFLLPFFIPTILAASTTAAGSDFGMPHVPPHVVGLFNFHSWALLAAVLLAIASGFGRGGPEHETTPEDRP